MTSTLGSTDETPKHVAVREHVRGLVAGAEPGSPIPSERELVQEFRVARMTVRQAIDALVGEGLLERTPGRGTFVAKPDPAKRQVRGFTEEVEAQGGTAGSRTLEARFERPALNVARALGILPSTPVLHWSRLRLVDDAAVGIEETYLPAGLLPGILDGDLPASLYAHLETRDLRPTAAEETVRAVLIEEDQATLLDCQVGAPSLRVTRRARNHDRVLLVSRTTHHPDRHVRTQQHDGH